LGVVALIEILVVSHDHILIHRKLYQHGDRHIDELHRKISCCRAKYARDWRAQQGRQIQLHEIDTNDHDCVESRARDRVVVRLECCFTLQEEVKDLRDGKRCRKRAKGSQPAVFDRVMKRAKEKRLRSIWRKQPEVEKRERAEIDQRRDSAHEREHDKLPKPCVLFFPAGKRALFSFFHILPYDSLFR